MNRNGNNKPIGDKMIKLSKKTYDRLCTKGKFQESFDQLIWRILDENDVKHEK